MGCFRMDLMKLNVSLLLHYLSRIKGLEKKRFCGTRMERRYARRWWTRVERRGIQSTLLPFPFGCLPFHHLVSAR